MMTVICRVEIRNVLSAAPFSPDTPPPQLESSKPQPKTRDQLGEFCILNENRSFNYNSYAAQIYCIKMKLLLFLIPRTCPLKAVGFLRVNFMELKQIFK